MPRYDLPLLAVDELGEPQAPTGAEVVAGLPVGPGPHLVSPVLSDRILGGGVPEVDRRLPPARPVVLGEPEPMDLVVVGVVVVAVLRGQVRPRLPAQRDVQLLQGPLLVAVPRLEELCALSGLLYVAVLQEGVGEPQPGIELLPLLEYFQVEGGRLRHVPSPPQGVCLHEHGVAVFGVDGEDRVRLLDGLVVSSRPGKDPGEGDPCLPVLRVLRKNELELVYRLLEPVGPGYVDGDLHPLRRGEEFPAARERFQVGVGGRCVVFPGSEAIAQLFI